MSKKRSNNSRLLQAFEAYLQAQGQRINTIKGNRVSVGVFLKWASQQELDYLAITYNDLLVYIESCHAKKNAKSTINAKLQGIKHFYNHLQQQEKVSYNPAAELRIKGSITRQPHDLLTRENLDELYQNYPNINLTGKRNKVILGLMIYQGLSSGEVSALELTDIKLEQAKIYIPSVGRSNSRTLKLEALQILQLQKYITEVRPLLLITAAKQSEKLFVSSGSGVRLENSLTHLLKSAKKLNFKIKDVMQIRASVITQWLKIHSIRQVQYMCGHRYVSSTERYRTDLLESLQEQVDLLHPLN